MFHQCYHHHTSVLFCNLFEQKSGVPFFNFPADLRRRKQNLQEWCWKTNVLACDHFSHNRRRALMWFMTKSSQHIYWQQQQSNCQNMSTPLPFSSRGERMAWRHVCTCRWGQQGPVAVSQGRACSWQRGRLLLTGSSCLSHRMRSNPRWRRWWCLGSRPPAHRTTPPPTRLSRSSPSSRTGLGRSSRN